MSVQDLLKDIQEDERIRSLSDAELVREILAYEIQPRLVIEACWRLAPEEFPEVQAPESAPTTEPDPTDHEVGSDRELFP